MQRRWLVASLLAALALPACSGGGADSLAADEPRASERKDDGYRRQLLALADEAAQTNGGQAKYVEAVRTTRSAAERLGGSSSNQPDVPVWVVQVSGSDYSCNVCSRPYGAEAPRGRYLTLVPTVDTYEGTSFGISPEPKDLGSLGSVEVLRDDR